MLLLLVVVPGGRDRRGRDPAGGGPHAHGGAQAVGARGAGQERAVRTSAYHSNVFPRTAAVSIPQWKAAGCDVGHATHFMLAGLSAYRRSKAAPKSHQCVVLGFPLPPPPPVCGECFNVLRACMLRPSWIQTGHCAAVLSRPPEKRSAGLGT